MRIDLTNNEAKILLHRLEVPDCIFECLKDEHGEMIEGEAVLDICEKLETQAHRGFIEIEDALDLEIVKDAVDGCTFLYGLDDAVDCGEMTRQKATAYERAEETLKVKVESIKIK